MDFVTNHPDRDVHIYYFSGLGADSSIFTKMDLKHQFQSFIEWEETTIGESIADYAAKLLPQIDQNKQIILIGVSFGGMVAIEVAKQIAVEKIFIVASVKQTKELPPYYRLAGNLRLNKLVPASLFKMSSPITNFAFSVASKEEKRILKNILHQTDENFLKWAMGRIVVWKNEQIPDNLVHIHGTKDNIMPIRYIKNCIRVKGGGHLMIYQKAAQISQLINTIIDRDILYPRKKNAK